MQTGGLAGCATIANLLLVNKLTLFYRLTTGQKSTGHFRP
jgi:hypothetical protein